MLPTKLPENLLKISYLPTFFSASSWHLIVIKYHGVEYESQNSTEWCVNILSSVFFLLLWLEFTGCSVSTDMFVTYNLVIMQLWCSLDDTKNWSWILYLYYLSGFQFFQVLLKLSSHKWLISLPAQSVCLLPLTRLTRTSPN